MASNAAQLFEYMSLIGQLKQVQRTGWVRRGVTRPESVADHMYRVAMMAMLAPPELNTDRCVKMALVHDMAECIVGDLTPTDGVSKEEKHRQEEAATKHMCSLLDEPLSTQLFQLWQDYEDQASGEAKFVKDLDRLDMVMQAYEYERQEQRPGFLQEFFDSTEGKFTTDAVRGWKQHLDNVRQCNAHSVTQDQHRDADVLKPGEVRTSDTDKMVLNNVTTSVRVRSPDQTVAATHQTGSVTSRGEGDSSSKGSSE